MMCTGILLDKCHLRLRSGALLHQFEARGRGRHSRGLATACMPHVMPFSFVRRPSVDILTVPTCQRPQSAHSVPSTEGSGQPVVDEQLATWLRDTAPAFDGALAALADWHGRRVQGLQLAAAAARRDLWWPFTQHTSVRAHRSRLVQLIEARIGPPAPCQLFGCVIDRFCSQGSHDHDSHPCVRISS